MILIFQFVIPNISVIPTHAHACPDKICDQISDAVLDAHLKQDPNAKVACGKEHPVPSCWRPKWARLETFAYVEALGQQSQGLQRLGDPRADCV